MEQSKLQEILAEMGQFDETGDYYAFTLTANEAGLINFSMQTRWEGWADEQHTKELRVPSLVKPERMIQYWQLIKQPYLIVNKVEHYILYSFLGGNALVNSDVVKRIDPQVLKPDFCVRTGDLGFVSIKNLPKQAFNHAPTPKQRMRIFKRDGFRCRICGRRPVDYTDVELHIHHIRPFGDGGLTEDGNLITLCHTCHKGLDPHGDSMMFALIFSEKNPRDETATFLSSVLRYRDLFWKTYSKLNDKEE